MWHRHLSLTDAIIVGLQESGPDRAQRGRVRTARNRGQTGRNQPQGSRQESTARMEHDRHGPSTGPVVPSQDCKVQGENPSLGDRPVPLPCKIAPAQCLSTPPASKPTTMKKTTTMYKPETFSQEPPQKRSRSEGSSPATMFSTKPSPSSGSPT